MPELRPVTKDNWRDLVDLKVRDDQKGFVATNLHSIAESQFGADYEGHWELFPFGIYEAGVPVGFAMYGLNITHPRMQAFIIRLMIDAKLQGKGYGRSGMQLVLERLRADDRVRVVAISYEAENEIARKLYASLGFVEPGEEIGDEVLALLNLR
jgi:diamine N-acetyltransferase